MKKKMFQLFNKFLSKCKSIIKKIPNLFHKKKKFRTLENVYEDPIYLLFPDTYIPDEKRKSFEGPDSTGSIEAGNARNKDKPIF